MPYYDYLSLTDASVPAIIVKRIVETALITERLENWESFYPEALSLLEKRATIDSVFYSNAIEMIIDDRGRVESLINGAEPKDNRDLKIIGYYNARQYVYDTFSDHPFTFDYVLKLHNVLMSAFDENAGKIRGKNNPHSGYGTMTAVSYYVDYTEVEERLKELCESAEKAIESHSVDRMLLITSIVSDFQSLSPFLNGNGRMYRLIGEYLMLRLGLKAIRYISLDKEFFLDIKHHANAIHRSSVKDKNGMKDYLPFLQNYLGGIYAIHKQLDLMFP